MNITTGIRIKKELCIVLTAASLLLLAACTHEIATGITMTPEEIDLALREGEALLDSDNDKDLEKAFEQFYQATEAGSDSAKVYLAYCYEYGMGTAQNMELAKALYSEAAAAGNQEALVKKDQLVDGKTDATIVIPGARPRDYERVVLLCDGLIKTPNGDGTFQSGEDRIIASTADEELLYLSFRNPGRDKSKDDLVLNATETAVSLLMWRFPHALDSMTDEEFSGMRAMLLSFQETNALVSAIEASVSELGYLDLDRIEPEAAAAAAKIDSIINPVSGTSASMAPATIPVRLAKGGDSQSDGPTLSVGSPYYWKGIKVVLDKVTAIPDTDRWKCDFIIYNYEPIWLSLMAGIRHGDDIIPAGDSYLEHIVKPQNSNYIFAMGGANGVTDLYKAQCSFWGDTISWLNGEKDFEDGYWSATETKFQMEVGSEQDVLLIYSATAADCPQLWLYASFKTIFLPLLKMIIKVDGDGIEDVLFKILMKYGLNADYIAKLDRLSKQDDLGPYLEFVWDTSMDILYDCLDDLTEDLLEKAIQPRYKKVVKKWSRYEKISNNKLATKAQFKQDLGDLKYLKKFLKIERFLINVYAWILWQDLFPSTFFTFDFDDDVPDAIDLGLSVKWASFTLGASKPEEFGDFYAWGETEPYYSSQDPLTWKPGKEAGYDWPSYKWCKGTNSTLTKYCVTSEYVYGYDGFKDGKTVLDPEDDAAHVHLGGNWRMPTYGELIELINNCTTTWTKEQGVLGRRFTSKKNGNSIFFPAAGTMNKTKYFYVGWYDVYYRTSSLYTVYPDRAWSMYFNSEGGISTYARNRYYGFSIRPVYAE